MPTLHLAYMVLALHTISTSTLVHYHINMVYI